MGEGDGGLDLIARKKVARVESHVKKTHTRTKCFPNFIKTAEFSSAAVIQRKTFKTGRAIQQFTSCRFGSKLLKSKVKVVFVSDPSVLRFKAVPAFGVLLDLVTQKFG